MASDPFFSLCMPRTRDRARKYFEALFNPRARTEECLDAAIERIASGMFVWHKRRRSVIRTSTVEQRDGVRHQLQVWDSIFIAAGEARSIINDSGEAAAIIVITPSPTAK